MFRMLSGTDVGGPNGSPGGPPIGTIAALAAVITVTTIGLWTNGPQTATPKPSEVAIAQRSAAVVAATYRAAVDIDRRDRTLLVSYDGDALMSADRFAWTVCDTIRNAPGTEGSATALNDWQVVALPADGGPGSCRIGQSR